MFESSAVMICVCVSASVIGCESAEADAEAEAAARRFLEIVESELAVGDPNEKIQAVLTRHGTVFSFDDVTYRYRAIPYRSKDRSRAVLLSIYVDPEKKFKRAEAVVHYRGL